MATLVEEAVTLAEAEAIQVMVDLVVRLVLHNLKKLLKNIRNLLISMQRLEKYYMVKSLKMH